MPDRHNCSEPKATVKPYHRLQPGLRFAWAWLNNPLKVGAVAPTTPRMAAKLASVVSATANAPVLELGPGTGVVTQAILDRGVRPGNIVSVEFSPIFLRQLRLDFPGVNFVLGDAFDVSGITNNIGISKFSAVISSLPLLNTPAEQRVRLIEDLLDLMPQEAPLIQFSYGRKPPVPSKNTSFVIEHYASVYRNIPPARLWVYRRRHSDRLVQNAA